MLPIENVVICAAGMGTRLGLNMPKCLVEINGKKIIEYQLELLKNIPHIRVVVGFMEEEVISFVKQIRPDVIFVRNTLYNDSTNAYSLYLGSRGLNEPYLMMDGDLILKKEDFGNFLFSYDGNNSLIGIMPSKTEESVFVEYNAKNQKIYRFSRKPISKYEWAGIAIFQNLQINSKGLYVYNELERYLPLNAKIVEAIEIDTPNDYDYAQQEILNW